MIKAILFVFSFLILFGSIALTIFKGRTYYSHNPDDTLRRGINQIENDYEDKINRTYDSQERSRLRSERDAKIQEFKDNYKAPTPEGKIGFIGGVVGIVVSLATVILVPGSFHQINTGEVAIVRHLGKITGTRNPGTHFDFYMTNKYETYDTKVQQDKIETLAYSKDGQTMGLEVFLQYQIQSEHVTDIATQYGSLDALQARIETQTIEKTKAVMSSAEAMTIIQNRATFSNDVSEAVRAGISDDYYVNVRDVVLTNIDFTDEFEKSIENKVIAEQDKQASITRAEAELEVAKLEAQKKIEEARGDAESQKIIAKASAEAATYNIVELSRTLGYQVTETYTYSVDGVETASNVRLPETEDCIYLSTTYTIDTTTGPGAANFKTLVEDYIKYIQYLSVWNGQLPQVVAGDDAISIIVPTN